MSRPGALARDLSRLLGAGAVSEARADREARARDAWPRALLQRPDGRGGPWPPDVVVWPAGAREVRAVVRYAARRRVPLVPFGEGSGVCGGAVALRGGILLDTRRMARVRAIDPDDHAASFEAGLLGQIAEDTVSRAGLTLGHFPSSIFCSTVGGWIAARGAGQCSSRYGKIEDMTLSIEAVTGAGEMLVTDRETPGDATGLLVGSEGTLAVITAARLRAHPAPETRAARGWRFATLEQGADGMRRVMQAGLRPAVLRLYDELDTLAAGAAHARGGRGPGRARLARRAWRGLRDRLPEAVRARAPEARRRVLQALLARAGLANRAAGALAGRAGRGCLLVEVHEGPSRRAAAEATEAAAILRAAGGAALGAAPGERWLRTRYRVSHRMMPLFAAGAFVDTMEVAAPWSRLGALLRDVRAAIEPHVLVMAHLSHAYPDGCSIYCTFVGANDARGAERYDAVWRDGMRAAIAAGSPISHHHGVGLLKAPFMAAEHGAAMDLLRRAKAAFDPAGVLNPGKLGL